MGTFTYQNTKIIVYSLKNEKSIKLSVFFTFQHSTVGKYIFQQGLFFFYRTAFFSNSFFSRFLFSSCFLSYSVCLLDNFFLFLFFYIYNTKYYIYGNINILYIFILPSLYYFLSFFFWFFYYLFYLSLLCFIFFFFTKIGECG